MAIVRISGAGSVALADKIFRSRVPLSKRPPRYMALGALFGGDGVAFDQVLAVRFEAGGSYTGEESAEIHCHGGVLAAERCIEELCAGGARIASPGEFTRRAFINGRIDLAQAEAVAGIIKARSDEALAASARSLQGELTEAINKVLERLTTLCAALEVDLDFPEEGEGFIARGESNEAMLDISRACGELMSRCKSGMLFRDGVRAAIIGLPNAGKSSLLNALLREERAIVTATPGTTRDSIEETFVYNGAPVRIIDTAGIRETSDEIEAIGVKRALKSMEEADVVLRVVDVSVGEREGISSPRARGKPEIIALNKCDQPHKLTLERVRELFPGAPYIYISALNKTGVEELKSLIVKIAAGSDITGGYSVSARQMECLVGAKNSVDEGRRALTARRGADVVLSCLASARSSFSSLLGLDASEELLDKIFGSFCVGK